MIPEDKLSECGYDHLYVITQLLSEPALRYFLANRLELNKLENNRGRNNAMSKRLAEFKIDSIQDEGN
jgi:hypothetical protein